MLLIVKIINNTDFLNPQYKTSGSVGMDLKANITEPIVLEPLDRVLIPTGLAIELPYGYEAQVRGRSGLALHHGIGIVNGIGTIDFDYRSDIGVMLINFGKEPFIINRGDRIAQLVINKVELIEWDDVLVLGDSERGDGGYGHTGI